MRRIFRAAFIVNFVDKVDDKVDDEVGLRGIRTPQAQRLLTAS